MITNQCIGDDRWAGGLEEVKAGLAKSRRRGVVVTCAGVGFAVMGGGSWEAAADAG